MDQQNHDHRAAAFRARPKPFCVFRLNLVCECIGIGSETLETKRQKCASASTGKKTEMADAYEALWKQMEQETLQEFLCG